MALVEESLLTCSEPTTLLLTHRSVKDGTESSILKVANQDQFLQLSDSSLLTELLASQVPFGLPNVLVVSLDHSVLHASLELSSMTTLMHNASLALTNLLIQSMLVQELRLLSVLTHVTLVLTQLKLTPTVSMKSSFLFTILVVRQLV